MSSPIKPFRRVVLKLSGESFTHAGDRGISMDQVMKVCGQIVQAKSHGCQIAIVIGGGNILRGSQFKAASSAVKEVSAHYMGMLATVINGLALQEGLESLGVTVRLMSAIKMENVCEPYIVRRAVRHLEKERVVVLSAGTGKPFVTTDTAAALYAMELNADVLMKATKVDGVYSHDPEKNPHATLYRELTYDDFLSQNLKVMDQTAITHCRDKSLPVLVFNFQKEGNIQRAVAGDKIGTLISAKSGAG